MRRDSIDLNFRANFKTLGPPDTPNIRPPSILVGSPSPRASGVAFRILCPVEMCSESCLSASSKTTISSNSMWTSEVTISETAQTLRAFEIWWDLMRFDEIWWYSYIVYTVLTLRPLYNLSLGVLVSGGLCVHQVVQKSARCSYHQIWLMSQRGCLRWRVEKGWKVANRTAKEMRKELVQNTGKR